MSKTKKVKNGKLWLNIFLAVVIFAATAGIVWGLLAMRNSNKETLGDEYFKSDDTKYVIDLFPEEGNPNSSVKTHVVYSYDGDAVTGMKTYFEYADSEAAEKALPSVKGLSEFKNNSVELDGKYIVVTANEDQYKGLTASDVKQQTEAIQQFQSSKSSKKQGGKEKPAEGNAEKEEPKKAAPEDKKE